MKLKLSTFIAALCVAFALLLQYEWYFRNVERWPPGYDNNADLWAYWRGKVEKLDEKDVVIVGSSRGQFDLNIHLWDSITGRRPVMLAIPGGSPYHTVEDIVVNTDFKGLLLVSTAPGLFYSLGSGGGAAWVKAEMVDYYQKQTYAQKFSQWCYEFIDPHFAYTDPDISLKHLTERLPFPNRDSIEGGTVWPPMVRMDRYRNVRMIPEMENDTSFQNQQTRIWHHPEWKNRYKDSADVIIGHYADLARKFQERGGRVAFIRPPVTGEYLEFEPQMFPRDQYWDRLLRESGSKGYHFQDNPVSREMIPPEWSHLNRRDADIYTRLIIELLRNDQLL
ncbi:MAG: hypothetical protein H6576_18640 [Lewinellaceae bacterium]|nr:hypothetical protein [Saprospiraceae bacterium]MCB9345712.1 hypothetical protein [Lewinellaceae bacterium]